MNYRDKVIDPSTHPRNIGTLDDPPVVSSPGSAQNHSCGAVTVIALVGPERIIWRNAVSPPCC